MKQAYFVLEFPHAVHGRVHRIHIRYRTLGYLGCALLALTLLIAGLFSSYVRMSWKVSHYNELRADFDHLRTRYQDLQRVSRQHNEQMASLETLAGELTVAYGINEPSRSHGLADADFAKSITPNVKESMAEYNFLKSASFDRLYHHYAYQWQLHSQPSIWPVKRSAAQRVWRKIRSIFGGRRVSHRHRSSRTGWDARSRDGRWSDCPRGLGRRLWKAGSGRPWQRPGNLLRAFVAIHRCAGPGGAARRSNCAVWRHRTSHRAAHSLRGSIARNASQPVPIPGASSRAASADSHSQRSRLVMQL